MILRTLLAKDLRRALRNPVPYLIHLGLPLVITALLGLVFGNAGRSDGGGLGRIRLVIVDEDDSLLTRLFRGVVNQEQVSRHLDVSFLARDEALRRITNNLAAAALILPADFTRRYLSGAGPVTLTLVKNPAQQFHPAIVEEGAAALTTALNAVARNFRPTLTEWRDLFERDPRPGFREVGDLVAKTGERFDLARKRLDPIPVTYTRDTKEPVATDAAGTPASVGGFDIFAFLLPGLTAMFLLFLADVAMRDLHREVRFRTFDRYVTLPPGVTVFVLSKVLFTFVVLILGCAILLGGGSLLFGFRWRDPWAVVGLAAGLSLFSGGLMAALNAWIGSERKADVINSMVGMMLGLAGGCAFPAAALPDFLRNHVTPWMPPNWFVESLRTAQFEGYPGTPWPTLAAKMILLGLVLTVVAAWRMRRNLTSGVRG